MNRKDKVIKVMNSDTNLWTELRTLCKKYTDEEVLKAVEVMFNCKAVHLTGEIGYSVRIIRQEIMNKEVIHEEVILT